MKRNNLISPTIIKHICRIANRGDIQFANKFLESQNLPFYINQAIKSDIGSAFAIKQKPLTVKKVPFSGSLRIYHPKESQVSSPRRFLNSSSRS